MFGEMELQAVYFYVYVVYESIYLRLSLSEFVCGSGDDGRFFFSFSLFLNFVIVLLSPPPLCCTAVVVIKRSKEFLSLTRSTTIPR